MVTRTLHAAVHNVELSAEELEKYPYVVARVANNELWYWDAYATPKEAIQTCDELGSNAIIVTFN